MDFSRISRFLNSVNLDWYHRLTRREQVLVLLVGGTAFAVLNLVALRVLVTNFRDLSRERAEKGESARIMHRFVQDKPKWDKRMDWLKAKQPRLIERSGEYAKVQGMIKRQADENSVVLSNQRILQAGPTDNRNKLYEPLIEQVDAKGSWASMVWFVRSLQQPENFIAFDQASLRVEPNDPNTVTGTFRVAKWYAPTGK